MRYIVLMALGLFMTTGAQALSVKVDGGYSDIISSKYDDAWVGSVRVEQPVYDTGIGSFSLAGEYHHVGKSWHPNSGWLSSNGFLGEVVYRPLDGAWDPYGFIGAGFYMHDWTNSDSLNAAEISVELEDEVGYKAGVGLDYHLDSHWAVNLEVYYYGSEYGKEAYTPDGVSAHVIGDQTLGNESVNWVVGVRYSF